MSPVILITTIISYILSLVVCLVLMILSKQFNTSFQKRSMLFHLFLLLLFIASALFLKEYKGALFLFFFCYGIIISGIILRNRGAILLKIIYVLFPLSIAIFLYSPSLLFSLLAQQKLPDRTGTEFLIGNNYYLVKQQAMLAATGIDYKLVQRRGKFNKTIKRDVSFGHPVDSIKVLTFENEKQTVLRGYYKNKNSVDSTDVTESLIADNPGEITVKHK